MEKLSGNSFSYYPNDKDVTKKAQMNDCCVFMTVK